MLMQVVSAMLRCHPGTDKRWIFNLYHWLGGNVAHIAGVTAIFLSTAFIAKEKQTAYSALLILYVIAYVVTHIVLELKTRSRAPRMYTLRNSTRPHDQFKFSEVADIQMDSMNNGNTHKQEQQNPPNVTMLQLCVSG